MTVVIIGAGASGLMCALGAAQKGFEVILLEKNEKAGKKIYITGKGRCNVTNFCSPNEFLNNVVSNPKFLFSAINSFSPKDTIDFFQKRGVKLVVERGNRVFPESYHASDITRAILNSLRENHVKVIYNANVTDVNKINNQFEIRYNNQILKADKLVIATGGKSYPLTGSTGDGYQIASKFGHTVIEPKPALVKINIYDKVSYEAKDLTLKNVALYAYNEKFKKCLKGELTFGPGYIDGPIVISMSSYLLDKEDIHLYLDLKMALTKEELDERLLRDFKANPLMSIKDELKTLLPMEMIKDFLDRVKIPANCKASSLRKEEREKIVSYLKRYNLEFVSFGGFERAIITQGGVSIKEINPKTFESKLIPSLYFVGEVIDVDALTGGFNMQIALATGYTCGKNMESKNE